MSNIFKTILLFILFISPLTSYAQKVLIIGIDGMRADVSEFANTPALDALKDNGIYSPDALNDDITISGPGWSAILCGVRSDKHLVTGNNFSNNNYGEYPSLFARIEEYDSSFNTVSICHWSPINNNIVLDDADLKINVNSDLALEIEIKNQLLNEDTDIIFGHFDEIDGAGHGNGFASDVSSYVAAIETVDGHISAIINTLEARPNYSTEDWLILVTSDHGGKGFSHGGNSIEEENVVFIASGESVNTSTIEKDSIAIIDNPENCLGDTTELKFDGEDDYVQVAHNTAYDFGSDQDFTLEC